MVHTPRAANYTFNGIKLLADQIRTVRQLPAPHTLCGDSLCRIIAYAKLVYLCALMKRTATLELHFFHCTLLIIYRSPVNVYVCGNLSISFGRCPANSMARLKSVGKAYREQSLALHQSAAGQPKQ